MNIHYPVTKNENKHLKERKNTQYFCQSRAEKQLIQESNMNIFPSYFLPPRMPGLVGKLLTIID